MKLIRLLFFEILEAFLFASTLVSSQNVEKLKSPCTSATTCSECIQTSPLCVWCGAEIYPRNIPRCDTLDNLVLNCRPDTEIINPKSNFQIIRNDNWTSGDTNQPPVQVKPQLVEFVIRPNEPKSFKIKFQQQANYPVDLYFLLDLSYSMMREEEAQKRLIALGNDIPESMANVTNNFRLGFGTFVDKTLMPYTAWTDTLLKNRCPLSNRECRYPHDFKNQLHIGSNQISFASIMRKVLETVSQSLDDAEAGLDGLIQVLDCGAIGWRELSRRIIVYSSNSLFHLAGAGKLGGATKQNKMKCNLTEDGNYAGGKIYDYPSVSQIAEKIRDSKANVIFAVMSSVAENYTALESFLDGTAVVGELEVNSKNIVGLIKEKYYELRSRIKFQPSKATNVDIKFKSKCKGTEMKETFECTNLEIMDSVEFDVMVTVADDICQNIRGRVNKEVVLNAVGLKEAVVMNLNIYCGCECENSSRTNSNNVKCTSGNGTFECGICRCNTGRFGRLCECDESAISEEQSVEFCKADRNDSLICSGNGDCICGVCECLPIGDNPRYLYTGLYCECNNYNCLLGQNRLLCGGPVRGKCTCGVCECKQGWSGSNCDCTTKEDSCLASNGQLCNGVGTCRCGQCLCNSGMIGPTCEDCLTCPSQCNEYVDCAQCKGFQSGSYGPDECEANCNKNKISKEENLPSGDGIRSCKGTDTDKCTFYFTYQYDSYNEVILTIQETKSCPKKVPLAAIIGGTVAAVVLIPLLLICLFILLRNLKDKKEFAKFLRDKDKARWDAGANPIYKAPTTTFKNPDYRGPKSDTPETTNQETKTQLDK